MTNIIREITPEVLYQWLKNERILLIDVREPYEFLSNCIDGAINIPLSCLLTEIDKLNISTNTKIILQCAVGVRSMRACQLLQENTPLHNLYNLKGGIIQWSAQNLPVNSNQHLRAS
ncbi:MAG: rhodanese-like domain-containing protein [Rickettsiaceae bacterium]|nr:rhodanese-like domain-containing protein [Rickettsiaceae bacterium]